MARLQTVLGFDLSENLEEYLSSLENIITGACDAEEQISLDELKGVVQ